jgi:hypothetical protein
LGHKTPSDDTKKLLMVIFDKTHSKQPKTVDLKNLKKKIHEPNVSRLLPNVCDFKKKTIP